MLGIRSGNCALVTALDDPQRIAAVVEAASNDVDRGSIARRLQQTTREASGLSLDEVVFLPKGAFQRRQAGRRNAIGAGRSFVKRSTASA